MAKKVTVGYRYKLGMHFGLCHGPVDAFQRVSADDRVAWTGSQTATGAITVDAPLLFGGDEKEGGIQGIAEVLMGDDSQGYSTYLQAKIGATIPAYRGILSLVWLGGLVCSNNPYLKPWSFRVKRILQGWSGGTAWYAAKAAIGAEDMNPAHIIYECLTNRRWGMGYPADTIDERFLYGGGRHAVRRKFRLVVQVEPRRAFARVYANGYQPFRGNPRRRSEQRKIPVFA